MIKDIIKYIEFILLFMPFILPFISLDWLESKNTICIYTNLTGANCFGCGITKSIVATTQFDFFRAFSYNKLVVVIAPLLLFVWLKRWFKFIKTAHNKT